MNTPGLPDSACDEEAARAFLEGLRWPNGRACPQCGSVRSYALKAKAGSRKPVRQGVYKCNDCRKQFTVTVGTIFEGSHIPLYKWLRAIHFLCASKKGMSAHQLHRMLDITYKSAWFMAHRIREAMRQEPLASKLKGTVEVDETYVGGKARMDQKNANKTPVIALVERSGHVRDGRVIAYPVERVTSKTLKGAIRDHVDRDSLIMTDEHPGYHGIGKEFRDGHQTVNHSAKEYARGGASTNTVEGFFSLLKRGINGTFHHVSKQHLGRYCDEFSFRYNLRSVSDGERTRAAIRATDGKRLYYRAPGGKAKNT